MQPSGRARAYPGNAGVGELTRVYFRSQPSTADANKGFAMKRILLGTFIAAVPALTLTVAAAQTDQQPSREERMQHWMADRETMLHARLAGMKAGLGLTADQEKFWNPFEAAVNELFKSRMEAMQTMMKMREGGRRMSPVERMDFMASRMAQGAANLKTIAEAAKPLYAGLDDKQKRNFEVLSRAMMMSERGPQPQSVEGYYGGGDVGFGWEPSGWWGMME